MVLRVAPLAACLGCLHAGTVEAGEVNPPAGASVQFSQTSPTPDVTFVGGTGSWAVPTGWSRDTIKLRVYAVKADGTKGQLVAGPTNCTVNGNTWSGTVTGLQPLTNYFVEVELRLTEDGFNTNFAFVRQEKKTKTLAPPPGGGGN